jgi:hypothetical protein
MCEVNFFLLERSRFRKERTSARTAGDVSRVDLLKRGDLLIPRNFHQEIISNGKIEESRNSTILPIQGRQAHCANNGGDIAVMLLDDKGNRRGNRTSEPRKY